MLSTATTLALVTDQDFDVLRELTGVIWRQHYAGMISNAQIDYMLAGRLSDDALRKHMKAADRWLAILRVSGMPVGYCAYECANMQGTQEPAAMKLGQLYVLESHRGMGIGRFMLGHVEGRARDFSKRLLWLQVNKKNSGAIGFYRARGFEIAREAVFDIGAGFTMDDYVMEKWLGSPPAAKER